MSKKEPTETRRQLIGYLDQLAEEMGRGKMSVREAMQQIPIRLSVKNEDIIL